jgi:ubiquinol-cytochrome c reductase cytochrome b subunit
MKSVLPWIDARTGLQSAVRKNLDRTIPGGAGWLAVLPSTILFTFAVEAITGLLLWMYYSPSVHSAWESVCYLQYEVTGGWLVRGIHHYAAQVLVALVALYVIQMVLLRGYRAPREMVFWVTVLLGCATMALVLTGDLLPWDQNGCSATQVRVGFLTMIPGIGGALYKLAAGGPTFGHFTLTRFFALHAGLFTAVFAGLAWLLVRLLGSAAAVEGRSAMRAGWYWPNQVVRNTIACALVLLVTLSLCLHRAWETPAGRPPGQCLGAPLGAPADPANRYAAARPEWCLLGVYGLSNLFHGDLEIVPIFVIPGTLFLLLLAMPWVGRTLAGHLFNVALLVAVLAGLVVLSVRVVRQDSADPDQQQALADGRADAQRAVELARSPKGIPVEGALAILRDDPKTQGRKLFQQYCASCHDHLDARGQGIPSKKPSAPNLYGFAGVEWLTALMDPQQVSGPRFFGGTKFKDGPGTMPDFVKDGLKEARKELGEKQLRNWIKTLAAEADRDPSEKVAAEAALGFEDFTCDNCHRFHGTGSLGKGPDLTGYGSREWLLGIISDPAQPRFYGAKNDRMPSFFKSAGDPEKNILTARQVEILVDWLRGKWYEAP